MQSLAIHWHGQRLALFCFIVHEVEDSEKDLLSHVMGLHLCWRETFAQPLHLDMWFFKSVCACVRALHV